MISSFRSAEHARQKVRNLLRWWRAPYWLLSLLTGAKSFADNPILASTTLNRAGLHSWRVQAAHALAARRRKWLVGQLPAEVREEFDRNGFIKITNVMPVDEFRALQSAILDAELDCRSHRQGDTITRRVPVGPAFCRRFPVLADLLKSNRWTNLLAYVATTRSQPLYYIQTIVGGVGGGSPDPQTELHSDTFHPSLKAWLFLTDVPDDGRPLTFVAGSHRLSPERLAWERRKSIGVMSDGDRLSQRGSLRVTPDDLRELGLPEPTRFCVPANTLVVVDTCGFHARADSDRPTLRVELFAYCRRNPFVPWTGLDLLSWKPLAWRRAEWLGPIVDWLDRLGWMKQHWRPAGRRRVSES